MKKIILSLLVLLIVSTGIACACAADADNATAVDHDSIQITDDNPVSIDTTENQDIHNIDPASDIDVNDTVAVEKTDDLQTTEKSVDCATLNEPCDVKQPAQIKTVDSKNGDDREVKYHDEILKYFQLLAHGKWDKGTHMLIIDVYKDHSWNDTVFILHQVFYKLNRYTPFTEAKIDKIMHDMADGKIVYYDPDTGFSDYDYFANLMKLCHEKRLI